MKVDAVVTRCRVCETALHFRSDDVSIVGCDDHSKPIEASPVSFHRARGNNGTESLGDRSRIVTGLDDVDQQPPTDVDSSEPHLVSVGKIRMGTADALEDVIRARAPEGGADEVTKTGGLNGGHHSDCIAPTHPILDTGCAYTGIVSSTRSSSFRKRARYEADRYGSDSWVFVRELLQNARDAGAKTVRFETAREADRERITCRDDGSGMSFAHARQYLFTLYASSKRGRSQTAGRFGIGFWSILRFDPQTIIVRSRPTDGDGWQVRLDGELERMVREAATVTPGTEVVVERPLSKTNLGERVRRAVLKDAPFLSRRGRGDRPLEVTVNGRRVRAEPELPPPSMSFRRRGLRGAVGLGAKPLVEIFAHGLRVRDAAALDELLLADGRTGPSLPSATDGLAPRVIIDSRELSVLMARGDAREDRALRRLVAIGHRELGRLVRAELDRFARPSLWTRTVERLSDMWSVTRARRALVGCAAIALLVGAGWLGMALRSGGRSPSVGPTVPGRGVDRSSSAPVPYRGLDREYRGPTVETLDRLTPPIDLGYRPTEEKPFIAALLIVGLAADGSALAGDTMGTRRYGGRSCTKNCIEIDIGIDAGLRFLPLPVPTGHVVDTESVRLDGNPIPVVELPTGQPAVRIDTPEAGRLRYRTGPGVAPETRLGAGWPDLPAELDDLARRIEILPRPDRAQVAALSVGRLVVYDTSPATAARYREPSNNDLGVFHRSLSIGAGDCDVQNSLVAAILESSGVPARLAVGWLGVDGRVPPGLHAWVEFLDEDGVWRVADASVPVSRENRDTSRHLVASQPVAPTTVKWRRVPVFVAVLFLSAGLALFLGRRRWRRRLRGGSETDVPGLLRGAATRPEAFARIRPLFTRRVVPRLGRPPTSLARARRESLRGRLYSGSRRAQLAVQASAGGGMVIDADLPAGRSVAEALGAVDLDRWQGVIDRSWSDDLTARVERALFTGGQQCRIRVASDVGREMMVLDGNSLRIGFGGSWIVVDVEGELWSKTHRLVMHRQPARAALWLADSVVHRVGVPLEARGRCLAGLAKEALVERAGGAG